MSFDDYMKSRHELANETAKALESSQTSGGFTTDPDDWFPGVDKGGNGVAIIRFLPPLVDERLPFVSWYSHNFQNPTTGKWYIENSLTTLGKDFTDPVGQFNKKLWDSTADKEHPNRKQASAQRRNQNFRANVYVISDSVNPENNNKIKKFKFGKMIFEYINTAMKPAQVDGLSPEDQEKEFDPFDMFEGANLRIQIFMEMKGQKKQRNYSKTKWLDRKPLGDVEMMRRVYDELQSDPKRWSLRQYIEKDQFKSYDELKKRLDLVVGFDTATGEPLPSSAKGNADPAPRQEARKAPETAPKAQRGDDDDDAYFNGLMDD
jgi:hypothetical protein